MSLRFFLVSSLMLTILMAVGGACTDSEITAIVEMETPPPYDNKLKLTGKFCTTDPADVIFPLKVMFVIDTSQSMKENDKVSTTEADPMLQTGRSRAIYNVINKYITLKSAKSNKYCNTGTTGCEKGSTKCATCGAVGKYMCIGPDCCTATSITSCHGVPLCQTGTTNGTCVPLCDTTKSGCKPGEKTCTDCGGTGYECTGGLCGSHLDPGVEFAIMRFGSAKQVLTRNKKGSEGFTSDIKELVTAIPQVNNAGSVTDYEGALSKAYKVIDTDIKEMKEQNAAAVSRSKYMVIFLSDGEPYPNINDEDDWDSVPCYVQGDLMGVQVSNPDSCDDDTTLASMRNSIQEYNISSRILLRVQEILSLKTYWKIGEIKVHTAFLSSPATPSWVMDKATYLLKQMALAGKGTFRSFINGEAINFIAVGFSSLRRIFEVKNFMISNFNARPYRGLTLTDSDGDGLDDKEEVEVGTNAALLDTDADGFSDTVEHFFRSSGWNALDPSDADCSLLLDLDQDGKPDDYDGDGLLDCEERFLGTSRALFDTDADGIPDYVEVLFGTNPGIYDIKDDQWDFDGMPNGDEIRLHTDPGSDDASHRSRVSYRYSIKRKGNGVETLGWPCTTDTECPTGKGCTEEVCRCKTTADCSSGTACKKDSECKVSGETCKSGKCKGTWACGAPLAGLVKADKVCSATKYITCYEYSVENITLVTPRGEPGKGQDGWNDIRLYFGETPFDNPTDYGNFSVACVRAYYNLENGAKLPATGRLTVPLAAWKDPSKLTTTYVATATSSSGGTRVACGTSAKGTLYCKANDRCIDKSQNRCKISTCICPDGKVGLCPAP